MTNKELARWFGITATTLSHKKEEKLEELKNFAEFELVGDKTTKIKITKVYEKVYSKSRSDNFKEIVNNIDAVWSKDGLDTCKRVTEVIMENKHLPITIGTAEKYTARGRNILYGKPFGEEGSLGACTYILCKKIGDGVNARFEKFNEEEELVKDRLIKKYFGDVTEKTVIVNAMVEAGEIRKEEAWDVLQELTHMERGNFVGFLKELQAKLNCKIIRATNVERRAFGLIVDAEVE